MDMFPYPSGEGLHVGHPLGYIASDIYSRFKKLKGFNVLHPQGYDSFGLPAEQYAIQTGQHPKKTTEENINTYRNQLDKIGFSIIAPPPELDFLDLKTPGSLLPPILANSTNWLSSKSSRGF